jgi:hypothetical protein
VEWVEGYIKRKEAIALWKLSREQSFLTNRLRLPCCFYTLSASVGGMGGILAGMKASPLFPGLTALSGLLLMGRELYKDGWTWLVATEGILNLLKVLLLVLASAMGEHRGIVFVLGIVLLFGLLSSHLPKEARERRIL